jgi:acetoin:2,6-dichlorophenolindophenol oxidoreductase subunit alpha
MEVPAMVEITLPEGVDELEIHRRMVLARRFDERVVALRLAGRLDGVVHPAFGQEAVAVGACAHLRTSDRITSTHRGHAHCIAKGADINRMMAELFGRRDGYCRGIGGSMHIADFEIGMLGANGIVAAGMPIATGAALAAKLDGGDGIALCFFSDGATGAGPFHETLNIAALWELPIVYLCENNGWAAGTAIETALSAESPYLMAQTFGMASAVVDGNDILAVLEATRKAIDHARSGAGPFLLEAKTFRLSQHAVRAAPLPDVRDAETLRLWREERDPIARHAGSVIERGVADTAALDSIAAGVENQIDAAIEFAEASPYPTLDDALEGLFAS